MLYEYAVLEYEYDENYEIKDERLVVEVNQVLADSEEVARAVAARAIPNDADLNNCEVLVRPFA